MSRADVASQHESRSPIGPAFENIWAAGFLTNCVKIQAFDQLEDVVLVRRITQTNFEPFGLGLAWFRRVAYDA